MNPRTLLPDVGEQVDHPRQGSAEAETTVREIMLRHPKTLSVEAPIAEACAALNNDHVHMVLLTDGLRLVGTLTRTELPHAEVLGPVLRWSTLVGRTVSPDAPSTAVQRHMIEHGVRRMAVVGVDGSLLGLMCLKQRMKGFCTDGDVAARP